MEKLKEAIKLLLQDARARTGVSAKEFAEEADVWSFHTYIKWENGSRTPTVTSLVRLAEAFGAERLEVIMSFDDGEELVAEVFGPDADS